MKKYTFGFGYQFIDRQRMLLFQFPYLDLQDEMGSIWTDKKFFERVDALLGKRFENVQEISSIAYYEQTKKELNPVEFNQFLEMRQLMLSSLETNERQRKYILILQMLLISLATKYLPLITDAAIVQTIVERTKALYQRLYNGMPFAVKLNKALLGGASLHFDLPIHIHADSLFPIVVVAVCSEGGKRDLPRDEDTEELSGMDDEWSEVDRPADEASTSTLPRLEQVEQVAPQTLHSQASFFQPQEVTMQHLVAEGESVERKIETLAAIHSLLKEKLVVSQPEFTSSKSLEESLPRDSVLKIAFRIIREGLALNKEQKFQTDKLDEAIRQLKMTFEAEPMDPHCEKIEQIYTLLNISERSPSVRF